jgi:hypothetical protein
MVWLFATTIISCNDAIRIADRFSKTVGLTYSQKIELIQTLKSYVPSCPIVLEKYEGTRQRK